MRTPQPEVYQSDNYVYVDYETTNLDKGSPYNKDNKLVRTAWRLGKGHPLYKGPHTYSNRKTEFEQSQLVEAIEKSDFFVAHNSKFEYGWLRRCGLSIENTLAYCTQIGEYVIAGNRSWEINLDACLKKYRLGGKETVISKMIKAGICPSEMPESWLDEYSDTDVEQGEKLFLAQRKIIFARGLQKVAFTRNIVTAALESIERTGMHLDAERVKKVHASYVARENELQSVMDAITGGINSRSSLQKAEFLYKVLGFPIPTDNKGNPVVGKKKTELFPDGVPTTDIKYVGKFKAKNKQQKQFLVVMSELNKIKDARSKVLDKMLRCVEETDDDIMYFQFNQTITSTHRLSSTGKDYKVQGQNIHRIFKPLFSSRKPGWTLGEADEAQLEYRMAVSLARDEAGKYDIEHGVDSHGFTASIIFKEKWSACGGDKNIPACKPIRTESKEHTFKPLYGGKSGTPREQEYYKAFQDKHKQIGETQKAWVDEVYRTRRLVLPTGLILYFEDAKMNRKGMLIRPDGRPVDQAVCNYPVQNIATAECVLVGLAVMWRLMQALEMDSFLVNTVHDSIVGEINPKERELFDKLAVYSLVDYIYYYMKTVYDMDFFVPLEAETGYKSHWSNDKGWEEKFLGQQQEAA